MRYVNFDNLLRCHNTDINHSLQLKYYSIGAVYSISSYNNTKPTVLNYVNLQHLY